MNHDYVSASFENRWLITGRLTTKTPLHVGAGLAVDRVGLTEPADKAIQVRSVFRDHAGWPCLPGSALKGILRSRMRERLGESAPALLALFGKPEGPADAAGRDLGHAGRVEFLDALAPPQTLPPGATPPPFWRDFDNEPESGRLTGITANVAIERRTRTAAHQKLFHTEFVPPGIRFTVSLVAQNISETFMAQLLGALEQFNEPEDPLRLGAKTGNGWGELRWKLGAVKRMEPADVVQWLKPGDSETAGAALAARPSLKLSAQALPPAPAGDALRLKITLHFDGPFLVKRPAPPKVKRTEAPNAEPYVDERGRVVLPGSAFRGVLRSQAERILRTLAPDPDTATRWAPDPSAKAPEEVRNRNLTQLSPIGRAFGATGWRSPVEVSAFRDEQPEPSPCFNQELVAIDRFTGGAAEGAKFKFRVAWAPVLTGTVIFRLSRWRLARADRWAPGLCALVLRDLEQGDLSFGLGAGKGYGHCVRAEFDWHAAAAADVESFHQALQQNFTATQD